MALFDPGLFASGLFADGLFEEGLPEEGATPMTYAQLVADAIAYFKLDDTENNGTDAVCVNENGTNLVYRSMNPSIKTTAGIATGSTAAMTFASTGSPDHISEPDGTFMGLGDVDQSISFWCQMSTANDHFFSTTDFSGGGGIAIKTNTGGFLTMVLDETTIASTVTINDGAVHHVVVVFDASENDLLCYLDGVLADTVTGTGTMVAGGRLSLAARFNVWPAITGTLSGTLDEVFYFDRMLDVEEVVTLYSTKDPLPGLSWSMAVFPDTQNYTDPPLASKSAVMRAQTDWVVNNQLRYNTQLVVHVGDLTNLGTAVQWDEVVSEIKDPLDAASIPYVLTEGNHDYDPPGDITPRSNCLISTYFPAPSITGQVVRDAGEIMNSYVPITMPDGYDYVFLSIEWRPSDATLLWADGIMRANPTKRFILVSHENLWEDNQVDANGFAIPIRNNPETAPPGWGQTIYDKLTKWNSNLYMVLSGHAIHNGASVDPDPEGSFGEMTSCYVDDVNQKGRIVHELTYCTQDNEWLGDPAVYGKGGGWFRMLYFFDDGTVTVDTLDAQNENHLTWQNNAFSFTLDKTGNPVADITSDLEAHYKLDEAELVDLTDPVDEVGATLSMVGNVSQDQAPLASDGGRSITLGDDQRVNLDVDIDMLINTDVSVLFWVRFDLDVTTLRYAMSDSLSADGIGFNRAASDEIEFRFANTFATANTGTDFVLGQAYHIGATRDGSTGDCLIYVDGVEYTPIYSGAKPTQNWQLGIIGGRGATGSDLRGGVDDLRVYNRKLTAAEVLDHMNNVAVSATSLAFHAKFDEYGALPIDATGNTTATFVDPIATNATKLAPTGSAMEFTLDGRINLDTDVAFAAGEDFSVAFWYEPNDVTAGVLRYPLSGTTSADGVGFFRAAADEIELRTANTMSWSVNTGTDFVVDQSYHIVVTYNGFNGEVVYYIDGVAYPHDTPTVSASNWEFGRIGGRSATGDDANGVIDDVRVYSRVLNQTDVTQLHTGGGSVTLLDPTLLKPGLTTSDGIDLNPSLTTSTYTGGTPSAADQIKAGLRTGDSLNPSLIDADGNLKPSLLK